MPSLAEILKDPNYINANAETKAAIFYRHSVNDPNYTGANDDTKIAIRQRFGVDQVTGSLADQIPGSRPTPPSAPEPSWTEKLNAGVQAVGGTVANLVTGIPAMGYGLAKDIYQRTVGNAPAGVSRAEDYAAEVMNNPVTKALQPSTDLGEQYQENINTKLADIPAFIPGEGEISAAAQMARPVATFAKQGANRVAEAANALAENEYAHIPVEELANTVKKANRAEVNSYSTKITLLTPTEKIHSDGLNELNLFATPSKVNDSHQAALEIVGGNRLQKHTSIHNEDARTPGARQELGLEAGDFLTPDDIQYVIARESKRADAAAAELPPIKITTEFDKKLDRIAAEISDIPTRFEGLVKGANYDALSGRLKALRAINEMMPSDILNAVRRLRAETDTTLSAQLGKVVSPAAKDLGLFTHRVAAELENLIETSSPEGSAAAATIRDARAKTAQAYDYLSVLNPNSGKVDGPKLITLRKNKIKPDGSSLLSGKLKIMADHAATFPKDNASVLKMASESTATPWDFLLGIESVHDPMLGAAVVGRLAVPSLLAKRAMQERIVGGSRVAADTVRRARETERAAVVAKAEASAKAAEKATKQAEVDRLAAEEHAKEMAAYAAAGAARGAETARQAAEASAKAAEEHAKEMAAYAEAGAARGAETARQAAAAKAEADKTALKVLGKDEPSGFEQAAKPEVSPPRNMLDVGTTDEPLPLKNSGVPPEERLADSHDEKIVTIEFKLRQEILDNPEHPGSKAMNRLIAKAEKIRDTIDGFNNTATKNKAKANLIDVENHFGKLLEKYGVGSAADAHGLLRKLYAGGKGETKLPVKHVESFSTVKPTKTKAERRMRANENKAKALSKLAEDEKARSAASILQESKKIAKAKPTTKLKLED